MMVGTYQMDKGKNRCVVCKKPGEVTQAPYPLPISECYCDICYELEHIAYWVWREMFPNEPKWNAPVPIIKSLDDIPSYCLFLSLKEVQEFYKDKLSNG